MSGRLVRKVLKQQEEQQLADPKIRDEVEESGPESPSLPAPSSRNPFDLLNDGDNDDDDQISGSNDAVETPIENVIEKKSAARKNNAAVTSVSDHKQKKKKKKKGKDELLSSSDNNEKGLDAVLENLSLDLSSHSQQASLKSNTAKVCDSHKQLRPSVLQVDPRYLNAENELRRIFGSKVVKSVEKHHHIGSSRQVRGTRRGVHIPRKSVLVTPSDHWPRWDGSLSMELLETKHGVHYFRYVHSFTYVQAQEAFVAAKAIHDLNGIANVLFHYPYHVESLITMAEYFKFVGEHQMAADAIAKCLYALECAWHPMFTPLQGNCQLKYSHEENKPMFTALFAHMKNMDRRGCHRSALEVCKLLLSLDSDDPMGTLFCIDYYSLRAEEYSWLEQFSEEYKSDNSLWLFPNFSYSLAICRSYLQQEAVHKDSLTMSGKAASIDLMKQALMLYPSVLKKLVAKVPLKDQAWTNILKHSIFKSDQAGNPSLDHLINIYVERSYIIWRLPDLHKLLMTAATLVIETLNSNSNEAKDWACVRREAFSSDRNEYSHLLVMDFSDAMPTMPPDNLQNFMDPRMREAHNGDQVANPAGGARAPRDLANRSLLAALFESVLPWVDYGEGEADEDINDQIENHDHEI